MIYESYSSMPFRQVVENIVDIWILVFSVFIIRLFISRYRNRAEPGEHAGQLEFLKPLTSTTRLAPLMNIWTS